MVTTIIEDYKKHKADRLANSNITTIISKNSDYYNCIEATWADIHVILFL